MPASIGWYETDDSTVLSGLDLGSVAPGSTGAATETRVKNDGDQDFSGVEVDIQQASGFDAHEYLEVAPDSGGSPGTFQGQAGNPLALGALAADAVASVWVRATVPSGADVDDGQVANLVVTASI